jgi:hypothetical protein
MIGQRGYSSFAPVAWGQKMKIRFIGSGILIKFGANEKCGLGVVDVECDKGERLRRIV